MWSVLQEWRSPRMGKIGCYIIGSIGAPINWSITSWAVEVHVCVVVSNSSQWGDPGEPTGWIASGNWVTKDVLKVSKVGTRFDIELKDKGWFESQKWVLGCRVWVVWKSMVHDIYHGFMKHHSVWPKGGMVTGMVCVLATPWHTMYPSHSVTVFDSVYPPPSSTDGLMTQHLSMMLWPCQNHAVLGHSPIGWSMGHTVGGQSHTATCTVNTAPAWR